MGKNKLSQVTGIFRNYLDAKKRSTINMQLGHTYYLLKYKFEYDYLFIHINKTAGSSISDLIGVDRIHLTALSYRNILPEEDWVKKFKFSFVRNPWDRIVSQYHHRLGHNQQNIKTDSIDFPTWVRMVYRDRNLQYINFNVTFIPQLDWLTDMDGALLVDFVGRYENLESDISYVKDKLKIKKDLPHLRSSKRDHYSKYYDSETKNIVGDFFVKDIDYFNYQY